jgi:CHAT domain-containing protein/tetratricopeptide (TPR) repeat protein
MASIRAFHLKAGWLLHLSIEQQGVDLYVRVIGPDGSEIFQVDSPTGTSGSEEVFLVAGIPGEYRIAVEGGGPYRARVAALRPASVRDRRNAEAEKVYHQARVLAKKGGERPRLERMFLAAAGAWAVLGRREREADAWDRIGRLRSGAADLNGAQEAWSRSWKLYHQAGARRREALILDNLALAFWESGKLEEAQEAWSESVPIWRGLKDPDNEAASANRVCQMVQLRGYAREALDCYERSLRSFRQPERQAVVRVDQGTLYTSLGELTRALDAYGKALPLLRDPKDREARSAALTQLGNVYLRLGAPHRALPRFQAALNLAREIRDPQAEAVALNGMGLAWQKAGKLDETSLPFRRALALFRKQGDVSGQGTVWTNLGWLGLARGETRLALDAFQNALELSAASGNRHAQAVALAGMARVERRQGNRIAARDRVERALRVAESLRHDVGAEPSTRVSRGGFLVDLLKASYLASRQEDHEFLIELLIESGLDAEALEASERSRARSLSDNLSDQSALSLPEIQASVLDRDTVLLEYALGEERSHLWWVTPDGHGRVDLPGRSVLEPAVRKVHEAVMARAAELSRMLLGPVADRIRGKRLLVVAPEILHYAPFEALPDPSAPSDPLIARHIVNRLPSASVLKKLRKRQAERKAPAGLLSAVGDPVSGDSDDRLPAGTKGYGDAEGRLPRLPDAGREVRDILKLARSAHPAAKVVSAAGFEATRDLVLGGALGDSSMIHLAAHGLLDAERPERSALLLSRFDARGRRREGRLTAGDVRGLDLPADLVVLSACQTALGRDLRGEGPMGLTHAFLSAGASGVVVSLWSVDDRATAVLMERFYHGLLVGGLPPAEALRQAQLALWRDPRWRDPFYWAGFVLEGDGLNKTRLGGSP